MEITLRVDGKDKIYKSDFISGRLLRNALVIQQEIDKCTVDENLKVIDMLVSFLVEMYSNQFSIDEVWDGISADKLTNCLIENFKGITGALINKEKPNPNPNR